MKTCTKCHKTKQLLEFNKDVRYQQGVMAECRSCLKLRRRKHYINNLDKYKNSILYSSFGITLEDYNKLLKEQKGVCKICKQKETSKMRKKEIRALAVDHNHTNGRVRALLCRSCNIGIGNFKENILYLKAAIKYIIHYETIQNK